MVIKRKTNTNNKCKMAIIFKNNWKGRNNWIIIVIAPKIKLVNMNI